MLFNQVVVLALVSLLIFAVIVGGSDVDYKDPIRSAAQDEITSLPGMGWKPNFKQYSGYLDASNETFKRYFHYWLVESESDPANDPLIIWIGSLLYTCSGLVGVLSGSGPFKVDPVESTLIKNNFAWNKHANIMYLDSTLPLGYSYYLGDWVGMTIAQQDYLALGSFMEKFPHLRKNKLYLAGEGDASFYATRFAKIIDHDPNYNFAGILVGNGRLEISEENKFFESFLISAYYRGLMREKSYRDISKGCCDGKPLAHGQCSFHMFIDDPCSSAVFAFQQDLDDSNLNLYSLADDCYWDISSKNRNKTNSTRIFDGMKSSHRLRSPSSEPLCLNFHAMDVYLQRQDTRDALHIPDMLETTGPTCSLTFQGEFYGPSVESALRDVLNSKRDLKILFYSGDNSVEASHMIMQWLLADMNLTVVTDFSPWYRNNQVAGFKIQYEGVTFMTIKGAGARVSEDEPEIALEILEQHFLGLQ